MPSRLVKSFLTCSLLLLLQCAGRVADSEFLGSEGSGGASAGAPSRALGGAGGTTTSTSPMATGGKPIPSAPACTTKLNLLSGDLGDKGNWIGGDPASAIDNPCGVQGLIYIMGDAGLDRVPGTEDDTCPYMDQSVSPCAAGRCCVSGSTRKWPVDNFGNEIMDERLWGCGIGISLNDPNDGHGTRPYSGPAKGFVIQLGGMLNGQLVRMSYTQIAESSVSPFVNKLVIDQYSLNFTDVACPAWDWATNCISPGDHPHALQIWAVGGDTAGTFELCIEAIYPIL